MTQNGNLAHVNAERWAKASVKSELIHVLTSVAQRLIASKARYESVEALTSVPWFIIAVIHEREASQSWRAQLGQGDPLAHVSIHVPKGRGPFKTWEDGAYDALVHTPPFAASWRDWSWGGALALLERYNGLGYYSRGIPSPYIWAGTDQYHQGKYIADGHFDPNAIDHQLGRAALLKCMISIDPTIKERSYAEVVRP